MMKELPPPIYSDTPGTWAHSTVSIRLPDLAGRVIAENQFSAEMNDNLSQLAEDIRGKGIRPLIDQGAPDQAAWESYLQPYLGQSWLEVPWFFAEHYFYRRIMEAVDYFKLGQDPFIYQKEQGLERNKEPILTLANFLQRRLGDGRMMGETLEAGMYFSLWGNQEDLSLWPADSPDSPKHASQESLQNHLLANDIQQVLDLLLGDGKSLARLDLMLDNAGFELVTDLALADITLDFGLVDRVVLHAKAHPTFVSDVIPVDVMDTVRSLSALGDRDAQAFSSRLEGYILAGKLQIQSNLFWNSPLPLWKLPDDLRKDWGQSSLVISKGDANYRRILGDLQWDMEVPFKDAVDYLPAPLVALRTLKAEVAVGLEPDRILQVSKQDPNWMVDGRWGVIHFAGGLTESSG